MAAFGRPVPWQPETVRSSLHTEYQDVSNQFYRRVNGLDSERKTFGTSSTPAGSAESKKGRKYRFGFILSTSLGNSTRYQNFRRFAERDRDVEFVWAPVKHYIAPDEVDPFARLPQPLRKRAIVLHQSSPVLSRFGSFDAVMIHMYEVDILTALRGYWRERPLRIVSSDDAPVTDPGTYPLHPVDQRKPAWKRALRLRIDLWRARRADLLIPYSTWAGDIVVNGAGVPRDRVLPIHVGLDLDLWRYEPKACGAATDRLRLLFVGGEFERKGGTHLLEAFVRHRLGDVAELHLVTKTAPSRLPPHVHLHDDFCPNDPRLAKLYREADIFVFPTTSDLSPWAVLEAMASGCPVVATPIGGIVDMVQDNETGLLVPVGDIDALAHAVKSLIEDPEKRRSMGSCGRRVIERRYDAAANVPRILEAMKHLTDLQRRRAA